MEATTKTITNELTVIDDPEMVKLAGDKLLTYQSKPLLIVYGHTQKTVEQIYCKFASETADSGSPFKLSIAKRGLVALDQWGVWSRVSNKQMREYILRWFQPCERIVGPGGIQVLRLLDDVNMNSIVLWSQGRYMSQSLMQKFAMSDPVVVSKPFKLTLGPKRS